MTIRRKVLVSIALAAIGAMLVPAPAMAGGTYPPHAPTCSASPSTVERGGELTVSGHFWGGTEVQIRLIRKGKVLLGTAPVSGGDFSVQVTIPRKASVGKAIIRVSGTDQAGHRAKCSTRIRIIALHTTSASLPLGAGVPLGVVLVLILGIGFGGFEAVRRRRALAED